MSTITTLQELAKQVRNSTLKNLTQADVPALMFAPKGTSNHMIWHAGHALWVVDLLGIRLLTGAGELPDGWADTFGMNCRPVSETTEWPDRDFLAGLLEKQLDRLTELLGQSTEERLAEPADPVRGPMSVSARITHGLHDEARHCGEMHLLNKIFCSQA